MAIRFQCSSCGREIAVSERLTGEMEVCKHCGAATRVPLTKRRKKRKRRERVRNPKAQEDSVEIVIPAHETAGDGLKLKPIETRDPDDFERRLLARGPELAVKPGGEDPIIKPKMISDPERLADTVKASQTRTYRDSHYRVTDPHGASKTRSGGGPTPFWLLIPSLTARSIAHGLRLLREWLYVVGLLGLLAVFVAYVMELRTLMHFGAVVVIASNISMLCVGAAYLVVQPFKEGFRFGLLNLFPPYAVYYWYTRWPKMKKPVIKTIGSFLPIALVGLAYLVYRESPAIEKGIEEGFPAIEKRIEKLSPLKSSAPGAEDSGAGSGAAEPQENPPPAANRGQTRSGRNAETESPRPAAEKAFRGPF